MLSEAWIFFVSTCRLSSVGDGLVGGGVGVVFWLCAIRCR